MNHLRRVNNISSYCKYLSFYWSLLLPSKCYLSKHFFFFRKKISSIHYSCYITLHYAHIVYVHYVCISVKCAFVWTTKSTLYVMRSVKSHTISCIYTHIMSSRKFLENVC